MFDAVARKDHQRAFRAEIAIEQRLPDRTRALEHLRIRDALPRAAGIASCDEQPVGMRACAAQQAVRKALRKRTQRFKCLEVPAVAAFLDPR
ncbi:hypothetical protein OKW28_002316 [Paraburkholderia sp. 40]